MNSADIWLVLHYPKDLVLVRPECFGSNPGRLQRSENGCADCIHMAACLSLTPESSAKAAIEKAKVKP